MCLDVDTITEVLNIPTHRIARIAEYDEDRARVNACLCSKGIGNFHMDENTHNVLW